MDQSDLTIRGTDGQEVLGYRWSADRDPIGVVQIAHGLAEHALRYKRFGEQLVEAGFDVYATDHRAHGRTADLHGEMGIARPGGWDALMDDMHVLTEHARAQHPDLAIILFGHSMGSFLAQGVVQRWGDEYAGLVLSGTTGGLAVDADTMKVVHDLGEGDAQGEPSMVIGAMFGGFNEPFDSPDASGFEWLSRDPAEVQAYVDDPWCGFPVSNGYVEDMLVGCAETWTDDAEARVPSDLPVLVTGGNEDPVGGGTGAPGAHALASRWRDHGVDVDERFYEGGRHEILNEFNRDEVMADLVDWIRARVA